ncbi:AGAMOUS-like 55 [Raphanus sativus]|uniref:Agamous-like MADS-box protein AGL97 n=1 Tax=Raphanus sativus TaxID=3726 RepID=A0A6J0LUP1_RAPSA|nr:agamous-like MADS-box protein AGL97 [Raphanus sativus]KAJ4878492.1 AGAMOUS-like 55 [Raphanus sativus]
MGGLKRKIEIKFIEGKAVRSVTFTKRRNGLFRKAAELCLLSPATQIAILATPPATNSHADFYSFGHSSVDHVVSSLLHDQSPGDPTNQVENRRLGFWWEDEALERLENVDELRDATDAVSRMLNNLRLRLDAVRSNQRDGALVIHQEEAPKIRYTNKEKTNQITNSEGSSGLVIHQDEVPQLCNTNTNNKNEETTTQIANSEGASGSGSLVQKEEDVLHIDGLGTDDFFTDFKFDPLFKF